MSFIIHSSSSINNSSSSKARTIRLNLRNKANRNNSNGSNVNPSIPSLTKPSTTHHSHTRFTRNSARDRAPNISSSRDHLQRTSRHGHNKSVPMNTIITKNSSSSLYPSQALQHQPREKAITSYPIFGQKRELQKTQELIKDLDNMIAAIKQIQENDANDTDNIHHQSHHAKNYKLPHLHDKQEPQCPRYEIAAKTLCEPQEGKLRLIKEELNNTNGAYQSKYECKEHLLKNEYRDLVDKAKSKLKAKYEERKFKQERLFTTEFGKHLKKRDKAKKRAARQQEMDKEKGMNIENGGNANGTINEKEKTPHIIDDVLFKTEKYPRYKILENGISNNQNKKQWPSFTNQDMEQKWRKISGIADRDMEADVNTMVADTTQQQQSGNHNKNKNRIRGGGQLEIKDILAMFPKCDITYKSDKNILTIQYEKKPKKKKKGTDEDEESSHNRRVSHNKQDNKPRMIVMHLKCGSYIATQQKRQSVMHGTIMSVSSKGIWARLRQKGAKNTTDSFLTEIKTSQIEEGSVKIKLIN